MANKAMRAKTARFEKNAVALANLVAPELCGLFALTSATSITNDRGFDITTAAVCNSSSNNGPEKTARALLDDSLEFQNCS